VNVNSEERLARATELFIRVRADDAQDADHACLKEWLEEHPDNAKAYREACAAWDIVGEYASAPDIMLGRQRALEDAHRARERKQPAWWSVRPVHGIAAGIVLALLLFLVLWPVRLPQGEVYETGVGDRRVLTLADGSIVNLDARSRLRVLLRDDARFIDLEAGQASFEVAKDPTRPFRVRAGEHTVIALGTEFNVEIVRATLLVTLLEGRVAVVPEEADASDADRRGELPQAGEATGSRLAAASSRAGSAQSSVPPSAGGEVIELKAGQQLIASGHDRPKVRSDVDLGRATAWQSGKLFFNDEPLADAAERMNRYAQVQIEVDPAIDQIGISGVFKAGDTNAFMDAVTTYFPVQAERTKENRIRLAGRR
jgi:transmembrane sensor